MKITTPISLGELYDKISILEIKLSVLELSNQHEKAENVKNELIQLINIAVNYSIDDELYEKLKSVNKDIWIIEDNIRECERSKDFSDEFIELARSVYITNDKRAAIKKEINEKYGSEIVEEKAYAKY